MSSSSTSIKIDIPIKLDKTTFQKMVIIYNAIQDGWCVKKEDNKYIFTKKHENKREFYLDNFVSNFIKEHGDISKI